MNDQTITVTLTEAEARDEATVLAKVRAALPPEPVYEVGQLARVTDCYGNTHTCEWDGEKWVTTWREDVTLAWVESANVAEVRLIRVLPEGHIAVKRQGWTHLESWRGLARAHRRAHRTYSAEIVEAYINALEAEAQP